MVPEPLPETLLVVGSGAIGMEFASFYKTLGSDVTVVEVLDRLLPVEDAEISKLAHIAFVKQGMKIHTGAKVKALENSKDKVKAAIETDNGEIKKLTFDRVILAIGIAANVENLGLEDLNIRLEKGHIVTDKWCRSSAKNIYAIGDVAGPPWLAHKASHEGVICVEKIAGLKDVEPLDKANIPGCTYCSPQIASLGYTEQAAIDAGFELRIGRFPFQANGKAIALGESEGLVKTIFDAQTGELLGAHMIGAEVTELIQGFGIAKSLESTEKELMHTVFAHPTLSEMMHESVLDAYGRVIHF